jgi:hypothetical protein
MAKPSVPSPISQPVGWLVAAAQQLGLRYEPDADERWLRAWEPYATIRVAHSYAHALSATGVNGSVSIARISTFASGFERFAWCAIVQDLRITARVALTNDRTSSFAETWDMVSAPRQQTGDAAFDATFATFAKTSEEVTLGVTPSLRRLLLHWRTPLHVELRPGGFVLLPPSVNADVQGLYWLTESIRLLADKAAKTGPAA